LGVLGNLIITAATTRQVEHPRVAVFGEYVNLLLAQGNAEAAIQMEKLGNQLANLYDVIFCARILLLKYKLRWTPTSSSESVRNTQPFIMG